RLADRSADRTSAGAALALAAGGRRDDAVRAVRAAAVDDSPRTLRRLVATAVALDATDLADELLRRLPADDPGRARLGALVAARAGDLTRAEREAADAGWRAGRLRRRIAGELQVLAPTERPAPEQKDGYEPVAGRVLHLVTNALPEATAGYATRTHGIVLAQRRLGLDAQVVTRLGFPVTKGALAAARLVELDGVPYHRLLPVGWIPAREDRALARDIEATAALVERLRPAVLHAHSKHTNAQVALAVGRRYGIPVVYEVRGFLEETWRSRGHSAETDVYRLAREAETSCMRQADVVVTLADVMRDEIVSRGIASTSVEVVPNAVDQRFLEPAPDPAPLRHRLGIPAGQVTVGLVTTLNEYEGVDTLVDAVALLRDKGAPVHLLVVGAGPAAAALHAQVAERGVTDAATFTGRVPFSEVAAYHAAIDLFCVPRADLPVCRLVTPLKPLEAMAIGRPVVASDLPPLREIVDPGHTGALVTPGDAVALAGAIEPLLYDSDDRFRMGAAARHWVAEHRTWDTAAVRYREIYDRLGDS
ncbi:MAG: glycosyltransferase family 4 protein, partial [Nocardioidaceae bacterium]